MRSRVRSVFAVLITALGTLGVSGAASTAVHAQGTFEQQCAGATSNAQLRTYCMRIGQGIEVVQPRLGIAFSGGNPVPGTASTLGMRLGTIPRFSVALRASAATVEAPPIEKLQNTEALKFAVPALNVDASVGVFSGISLLPTVGGFGSVDLLGSIGILPLAQSKGFTDERPLSWSVGARVGLIRESFTAPGISVSGAYRKIGTVSYGDSLFQTADAYFDIDDASAISIRGAISKRIPLVGLGFTVGAGYDRYDATAAFGARDPSFLSGGMIAISRQDLETDRVAYFANASWTLILVHFVGEIGVQQGLKDAPSSVIGNEVLKKSGVFGGLAVRIAL
ncbi:MAG: hypothetical protein ABIV28_09270 [Longimicrobiales bacterium]